MKLYFRIPHKWSSWENLLRQTVWESLLESNTLIASSMGVARNFLRGKLQTFCMEKWGWGGFSGFFHENHIKLKDFPSRRGESLHSRLRAWQWSIIFYKKETDNEEREREREREREKLSHNLESPMAYQCSVMMKLRYLMTLYYVFFLRK